MKKNENTSKQPSLWRRFFALLIDIFLVMLIVAIWKGGASVSLNITLKTVQFTFYHGFEFIALLIIYSIITEALWKQTLGKRLLGLQVANLSSNKNQIPSLIQIILRNVIKPFDIFISGFGSVLLSPYNQILADRVARTQVLRVGSSSVSAQHHGKLRKLLGLLFLIVGIYFLATTVFYLPRIIKTNLLARSFLSILGEELDSGSWEKAWEISAQVMKDQLSAEQFRTQLQNPKLADLRDQEAMESLTFDSWTFSKNQAIISGHTRSGKEISLWLVREGDDWKMMRVTIL